MLKRDFDEWLRGLANPLFRPGDLIDQRYCVSGVLGSGGMGDVYAAEDLELKRSVAIKCLKPELGCDPESLARFEAEAQAAGGIGHPHIVEVWDTGKHGGRPYFCMELLKGRTLQVELDRRGPIENQPLTHITKQLCSALGEIHRRGIVHRDLKPANVFLISRDGNSYHTKLGDFGVAKTIGDASAHLTETGDVLGTLYFMAPEQVRGDRSVDHRVDIYALGVTLYYCATGRRPFEVPDLAMKICNDEPEPPENLCPSIAAALPAVIKRAMAKRADDRFQSVDALLAELSKT